MRKIIFLALTFFVFSQIKTAHQELTADEFLNQLESAVELLVDADKNKEGTLSVRLVRGLSCSAPFFETFGKGTRSVRTNVMAEDWRVREYFKKAVGHSIGVDEKGVHYSCFKKTDGAGWGTFLYTCYYELYRLDSHIPEDNVWSEVSAERKQSLFVKDVLKGFENIEDKVGVLTPGCVRAQQKLADQIVAIHNVNPALKAHKHRVKQMLSDPLRRFPRRLIDIIVDFESS